MPSDPTDTDAALVKATLAGDGAAFERLVRAYQKPIFLVALRYVRNEADAADVAQQTFLRAYKSLPRFRGDSAFRSWLYRIAINLSLNHIRDTRREQPREHLENIAGTALTQAASQRAGVLEDERAQALRAAIAALPHKQRMVMELRIYDELPFREVGQLADCSENSAKVNFHHALKRLREMLDPGGN